MNHPNPTPATAPTTTRRRRPIFSSYDLSPRRIQIPFCSNNLPLQSPIITSANNITSNKWSLQGMTALVTGGTRGIGFVSFWFLSIVFPFGFECDVIDGLPSDFTCAIVEELVGLGANVHTCWRDGAVLGKCLEEWKTEGGRVSGSVCDVSDRGEREALMEDVFDGKFNILVNNVGMNIRKPMVEFTAEQFSTLMATNFESVFHLSQLSYPLLKALGMGNVVFMSSVSGFASLKSMSLQGATKGAINQLTRNLACEWAKDNIRSNAVAPWYIKTSMVEKVFSNEDYVEEVLCRSPLRHLGDPTEVSTAVAFLCLPASSYITGEIICINGGMCVDGFDPSLDP